MVATPTSVASLMRSPPLPKGGSMRSWMACDLDRVIVILARHLYWEVSVGLACNVWYCVKIQSTAYIYVYVYPRLMLLSSVSDRSGRAPWV